MRPQTLSRIVLLSDAKTLNARSTDTHASFGLGWTILTYLMVMNHRIGGIFHHRIGGIFRLLLDPRISRPDGSGLNLIDDDQCAISSSLLPINPFTVPVAQRFTQLERSSLTPLSLFTTIRQFHSQFSEDYDLLSEATARQFDYRSRFLKVTFEAVSAWLPVKGVYGIVMAYFPALPSIPHSRRFVGLLETFSPV
jgi:hypothetical protein